MCWDGGSPLDTKWTHYVSKLDWLKVLYAQTREGGLYHMIYWRKELRLSNYFEDRFCEILFKKWDKMCEDKEAFNIVDCDDPPHFRTFKWY